MTLKILSLVLVFFIFATEGVPQGSGRRSTRRPAAAETAKPQPTPQSQPTPVAAAISPVSRAPIPLATLNGQAITIADIDPKVRTEVEALDARIAEARRQVLELQINTLLLESEAAKRRITPQQLYELEIAKKITEPGAAEIDKFIQNNRTQIAETDPAVARQLVVSYLKDERQTNITNEFLKRLRVLYPVVNVAAATGTLPLSSVIVTVGGRPLTAGIIEERLKPIIYKLRLNSYKLTKEAVDRTVYDLLLLAESNKRNVPPEEIVRKEISEKAHAPTEAEVAKFYSENKTRIPGELATVRHQIASYLQEEELRRLEQELSTRLRAGANIRMLISEPVVPIQVISADDDPSRGDANAAVTIVEFTDFQCPSCAAMQPILDEVQKIYGNKVKLVVRDFPLNMHANALKAAEAANAAHAQGKFFEYAALLFQRQKALDVASLKKYASELGLNRAQFDTALDGGKYAAEVKHDMDDGNIYGVDSTPAIFVNGMALTEMSMEALRALIDRRLAAANSAPRSSTK